MTKLVMRNTKILVEVKKPNKSPEKSDTFVLNQANDRVGEVLASSLPNIPEGSTILFGKDCDKFVYNGKPVMAMEADNVLGFLSDD